ncbi:MobA-like NTP transferase protein [Larkinella arboricola]|uniref:MobA-like NTP transferase protein n=1 Tax=Larkinella arboricola TaxID=643671 RepID=A0A327WLA2_LARAB|nr:NTP transferase domain-containing protein [Larkinella arboricola]RAJ92535.1 MobA-like NTP transferase protein [Larkinella arboricola]
MMNYAIIAAGEGSRLAQEGFTLPKPMVSLHGERLIDRLIGIFSQNRPASIRVIINEQSAPLEDHLSALRRTFPVDLVRKSTPSSLHSFHELLKTAPDVDALCLATTDTVFKADEFGAFITEFERQPELDGLMAVTTFVDDESPLFISAGPDRTITAFTDQKTDQTAFVSGGIYCLRRKALDAVAEVIQSGTSRMRNYQRYLLESGLTIKAFPFSKIVDVDHVQDIRTAELFLSEVN